MDEHNEKRHKVFEEWWAWHKSKPKRRSQMTKRDKLRDYVWNSRDGVYRFNVLEAYMEKYAERRANDAQETSQSDQ